MAYDERVERNLKVWRVWTDDAAGRWDKLVEEWRGMNAGVNDAAAMAQLLMKTVRDQAIDNLDVWNRMWFETGDPLPSVIVTGASAAMNGASGIATVGPRLTGLALDGTTLEELGGNHTITGTGGADPGYSLGITGAHAGKVKVTMIDGVPNPGTYRGLLRYVPTGGARPEPLAWLFVVAT